MNNITIILAWCIGILIVLLLGKALMIPLKLIGKLIINGVLGGVVIVIINYIGQYIGFTISLNAISALIVGFLGLPGVLLLIILKFLL